jgi:4-amino-4-deoxy-L-arabinose transferase-like glycosyltransferase
MDMQLIFVLLVAAHFLFRSLETGKWRYLFLCALFVGLGFNVKMLQAYMILPAIVIVYLIFAKEKFWMRVAAGALGLVLLAAVSFAWVAAVDLTRRPAAPMWAAPPIIPSCSSLSATTERSACSVPAGARAAPGETALQPGAAAAAEARVAAAPRTIADRRADKPRTAERRTAARFPGRAPKRKASGPERRLRISYKYPPIPTMRTRRQHRRTAPPIRRRLYRRRPGGGNFSGGMDGGINFGGNSGGQAGRQGGGMGGGGNEIGTPGVLRLWGSSLFGQASWLFVLALFCILVKLKKFSLKNLNARQGVFLFW